MNDEDIKVTDSKDLHAGLSSKGNIRTAILIGPTGGKVVEAVTQLGNSIIQAEPQSFWINLESEKTNTPYAWCSQFARNLRTNTGVPLAELAKFALNTGKSLSPFKNKSEDGAESIEADQEIADKLIENFEVLIKNSPVKSGSPHLVLAMSDLAGYSDQMHNWLGKILNPAIRNSKAFRGARFLFTSEQVLDREKLFFDTFGFAKIHVVEIEKVEAKSSPKVPMEEDDVDEVILTKPDRQEVDREKQSPKLLKKNTLPSKLKLLDNVTLMDLRDAKKLLSSFKDEEINYLFIASYPTRISRYSLEHFDNNRNAALSFNWLKRSKSLYRVHESGDLLLNEDLRAAARALHAHQSPDSAESWGTLAAVLDTFQLHFPEDSTHWIPINLQLLESFTVKMLAQLFEGDALSEVLVFVENYKDNLAQKEEYLSLSDEVKLVVRRYLELTGRSCIANMEDRIRELWLKDQEHYKRQKAKMLEEKTNLYSDIEGTLNQVATLKEMMDNLTDKSGKPSRNKPERIYSFSTSRALLVIGILTIGVSLLSESVGFYYAATGLALTMLGFFWPNVEVKGAALASGGAPGSSLAIETQHRSLNYRVGSLSNRVHVMKSNLDAVEKKLSQLGENPPLPYLDSESTDPENMDNF